MLAGIHWITALQTVTLLCGVLLAVAAYRAYRRTSVVALGAVTVGITLVTVGSVLGGTLHRTLDVDLMQSLTVQSLFTAAGFVTLAYSLYAGSIPGTERTEST